MVFGGLFYRNGQADASSFFEKGFPPWGKCDKMRERM
jgi:hypothetical protein